MDRHSDVEPKGLYIVPSKDGGDARQIDDEVSQSVHMEKLGEKFLS